MKMTTYVLHFAADFRGSRAPSTNVNDTICGVYFSIETAKQGAREYDLSWSSSSPELEWRLGSTSDFGHYLYGGHKIEHEDYPPAILPAGRSPKIIPFWQAKTLRIGYSYQWIIEELQITLPETCGYKDGSGVYCARPKSKNRYDWCEEHWSTVASLEDL